jgi:hypothetical protein
MSEDPKDQLQFHQHNLIPDAGIYRTPTQSKVAKDKTLPTVGSRILTMPAVQTAYASFGLDGLKSILLQELVKLDWAQLQDEMVYLAEGANEYKDIKRTLRATKLLAAQWLEDPRQLHDTQEKCQFIFDSISTFGTIEVQAPDNAANAMAQFQVAFPNTGPLEPVPAEAEHALQSGNSILLITDLQGHYGKLETLLQNIQLAQKKGDLLHWTASPEFYLMLVGDLFNKSPYSTWGDSVGFDTYSILRTLQRFMKVAPDRILVSFGAYDLDIASKAALYHPVSGFMGSDLGVNAQAQAIPALLSFIKGTGTPNQPDFAWEFDADQQFFELASAFQVSGVPYLTVPPNAEGGPDISALVGFYEALYQALIQPNIQARPRNIQELDLLAGKLLPATTQQLNLQVLKNSLGRCLHFEGLLQGTGSLKFLRERIAGMHIFQIGQAELFAVHPEIQEISLDMLAAIKAQPEVGWELPEMEKFLLECRTLPQWHIDPQRWLGVLQSLQLNSLNEWLGLPEGHFYQLLKEQKMHGKIIPEFFQQRDEKGFLNAYRQFRWELINEDPTGIAGFALNMDGISRRGEPIMRKMAQLDERSRKSYTKTFLMDLFREELPFEIAVEQEGIVAEWQGAEQGFVISLLIDEAVAIYKDVKEQLHMPVKHAAWIELR